MATPPPQPTRQQLDDLDALLQRMLALPVNPGEDPADAKAAGPADATPRYPDPPAGNMILSEPEPPPAPSQPPPPPDRRPSPRPAAPRESVQLPLLNPVPPAERRAPVLPPPERPQTPRQALAASRPRGIPFLLRPLLWLNRQFDSLAFNLGAPGRWLRRPAGRTLLGLVGLLLLAAAVALAFLDRIGWTW
ncbi:MAG TPA: hypothetical protein VKA46_36960 [Gemmataceae bacterium]|nr:hypothetical protein [Gemmataceae bacterium]